MADEKMKQGTTLEEEGVMRSQDVEMIEDTGGRKIPKPVLISATVLVLLSILFMVYKMGIPNISEENEDDEVVDNSVPPVIIVEPFSYSRQDIETLRSYGYTGDEIEKAQSLETPLDVLIDNAKSLIDQRLQERYVHLSDEAIKSGTPEFEELKADTWVGGEFFGITEESVIGYTTVIEKENVDYKKVSSTNYQLFIKLTLADDTPIFMYITPTRWSQLEEEGNMVIEYTYNQLLDGTKVIVSIREIMP